MDPETECIEEPFLGFPAGTNREELWHWFDKRHSKGVAYLLYRDGIDRTDQFSKLVYLKTSASSANRPPASSITAGSAGLPWYTRESPASTHRRVYRL